MNLNVILSKKEPEDKTVLWIDVSETPISAKIIYNGSWTVITHDLEGNPQFKALMDKVFELRERVDNLERFKEKVEYKIKELIEADEALNRKFLDYVTLEYGNSHYGTLEEQKSLRHDVEDLYGETAALESDKLDKTEAANTYTTKAEFEAKNIVTDSKIDNLQNELNDTRADIESNYVKSNTFNIYKEEEEGIHQAIQESIQDTKEELTEAIGKKQDKLKAGYGINIKEDNTIESSLDLSLYRVVDKLPLPEDAEENKIYFIKNTVNGQSDIYIEYIVVNGKWEKLGEYKIKIDLSGYLTTEEALQTFVKVDGSNAKGLWNITAAQASKTVGKLIFKGYTEGEFNGYNDKVINIPYSLSQLHNDMNFVTRGEGIANPYPLVFIGNTNESYDGSKVVTVYIPSIPDTLPNPEILTWTGYSYGNYDGKERKNIEIPSDTSQLTNNAGFITSDADITGNAGTADALRRNKDNTEKYSLNNSDSGITYGSIPYVTNEGSIRLGNTLQLFDNTASVFKVKLKGINKDEIVLDFPSKSGTFALISDIPTKLPNPQALKFTGALTNSYDGLTEVTIDLPTKYPNPNALTFNGAVTGTYDGSQATEIIIPSLSGGIESEDNKYVDSITVNGHTITATSKPLHHSFLTVYTDSEQSNQMAVFATKYYDAFSILGQDGIETYALAEKDKKPIYIRHKNKITAGTIQGSSSSVGFGGNITIPKITYDAQGHITSATTTSVTLPTNPNTDTKNTAGSTNKVSTKLYLIGAESQADNPQTYSNVNTYIGTDNCLYSGGKKVLTNHQSLSNYVTLNGIQTITGKKTFQYADEECVVFNNPNGVATKAGTFISYNIAGTRCGRTGYNYGLAWVANEASGARIGVADDGTPQYRTSFNSGVQTLLHSGNSSLLGNTVKINGVSKTFLSEHQSLANYALKTEVSAVQTQLNTLVENNDTEKVINSFKEIEAFLKGITNEQTLTELIKASEDNVKNWVTSQHYSGTTGTVTSVGLSVPTGLTVSGSPIIISGTLNVSLTSGYEIPTTAKLNSYLTSTNAANTYVKKTGDTMTGTLISTAFIKKDGTSSQFLKADGSVSTLTATATKGDTANVTFDNATGKFTFTLPKGDTGAQGPKGETGAVGPQGPAGAKGDTWVPSVNSSTGELTWTKNGSTTPTAVNIKGPKGDTGAKGDKGEKGDTGLTGAVGPAGPQGKTGATGPAGPKGDKGDTGAQGLQGPKGNTGPAGPTGAQGPTGPQGPAGKVWKPYVQGNSINWKLEDASSTTTLNSTLSIPWSSITSLPDTLVYYDPDNYSIYQYGPRDNINELRLGSIDNPDDCPNTLYFGDGECCYIQEDQDDHLLIRTGSSGVSFNISDYTVELPKKSGTIALLSDIPSIPGTATQSANGLMSAADKKKLDNLSVGTDLPVATSSVLGGIKLGYAHANTKYPVALDTNNKAYVDVPYTDFDNAATRAVVYNLKPIEIRDSIVYCSEIICTSRPNNGGYSKSGDGFDIGIRPKSNPECLWRLQTVKDGAWFNNGFSAWENGNFTIGLKGMNDANKLALTGSILASAFNQDSDIRLKDDIKEAAFEEIKRISSVKLKSFVLKDDKEKQLHYGYIAQEVEDVMPEIVMRDNPTDEEPDPMRSLNYTEILALKTAYLEKKNADLEARIQNLESLVAKLTQPETEV